MVGSCESRNSSAGILNLFERRDSAESHIESKMTAADPSSVASAIDRRPTPMASRARDWRNNMARFDLYLGRTRTWDK
ncbi:hypothetical protein CSOJ01_08653 [Colletotrichum sojae]|uniref:Uncharacterized protein n=1 Tax=Colletotrichum sojae TaxID=2175907 RepID=A0A8H6MSN6_9PEZI|nr:hypothetical protein CSOJ01_08653 [Colletotrichum sojae]